MLKSMLVRDYMSTKLVTLDPDMDILRAVHELIRNNISGAPVLGEGGKLVGILTERDCMRIVMQADYYSMPGGPVGNFMSDNPQSISPEESILNVAQFFINGRFHRYPVVENDRLVGMISRRDVMRAMGKHYLRVPKNLS
jgi:CBS domain-containing protein